MDEIDDDFISDGYTYCGDIAENVVAELELSDWPVLMKDVYAAEIANGPIGKFLRMADIDYGCVGTDMFISVVGTPQQVRDGGGGALLFVTPFDGFTEYGKKVDAWCYAMRIVPVSVDGYDFGECVDFETHYNLYRNDAVLWEYKKRRW